MNIIASIGDVAGGIGILWVIFALAKIWDATAGMRRDQNRLWRNWMKKSEELSQQSTVNMAMQIGEVVAELRKLRYALDPKAELVDQEEAAATAKACAAPDPEKKANGKYTRQVRRMDCPGCKATLEVPAVGNHVCPHCGTGL